MLQCWELEPKGRPSFSDLVSSLSLSLEAMAGYMDVGAFGEMQVQPLQRPGNVETIPRSRKNMSLTLLRKKEELRKLN